MDELMPVSIEDASIRHLDKLYEIEIECFKDEAFTKQQIAKLLKGYNSVSLIAKEDGEIIGFVIGLLYFEGKGLTGHILTLNVSPDYRRKGVGVKLLEAIEKIFRDRGVTKCCLEVREDNVAALNLYRKLGYKKAGRLEGYYKNAHGIFFEKSLVEYFI